MVSHHCSLFIKAPVFDEFFHQIKTPTFTLEKQFIQISTNICNKFAFSNIFSTDLISNIHVHESNKTSLIPVAFYVDSSFKTQFISELHIQQTTKTPSHMALLPSVLPINLKY